MKKKEFEVHVVSHTHWDREWHSTFEEFRMRLVKLVDKLLDILKNEPGYKYFVFDGQTIVLDDYLAIRPEKKNEIKKLIAEGRLLVGPWYILPDEFLVSGEALIRNLLIGHKSAREYGKVMKVGYIPDPFGHISQLPQILRGFGIDSLIFTRGMGVEGEKLGSEFIWQSPDDSDIYAIRQVGEGGYCNGAEIVHSRFIEDAPFDPELSLKKAKELLAAQKPYANTKVLLINNGFDHLEPQRNLPEALRFLNSRKLGARYIHSTYDKYLSQIRKHRNSLLKFKGELRKARYSPLLPNVLSTRMYIKQENFRSQNLLERYAEPLSCFAMIEGRQYPSTLLEQSWKYTLQSHPHDSICGCSTDEVHRDVVQRFHWSAQISEQLMKDSMDFLACHDKNKAGSADKIAVFNTLPWKRTGTVNLEGKNYIAKAPACGYAVYRENALPEAGKETAAPRNSLENDFIRVEAGKDGMLVIEDKRTGNSYKKMNFFEDIEDCGDEYNYSALKKTKRLTTAGYAPKIEKTAGSIKITYTFKVPKSLSKNRGSRSAETVICPVTTRVSLEPNSPLVKFETEINNRAEDHRIRAGFDPGIKAGYSLAESQFDVVKRGLTFKKGDWCTDMPIGTYPQQNFVVVKDSQKGMILVNKGLPEFELSSKDQLYLTLFRSVGWLSREDFIARKGHAGPFIYTPEAQCIGKNKYEYAIIPFAGDWNSQLRTVYEYITPLAAKKVYSPTTMEKSYFSVEQGNLIVTAIKKSEKGGNIIVRLFNPTGKLVSSVIKVHKSVKGVREVRLDESPILRLPLSDSEVRIAVKGHKIMTLELIIE